MIRIEHLQKIYGAGDQQVAALDDVSLSVQAGEVFGVLGQSGAGKSTLIRCVNMLERPTSGSVVVNGQEMTALDGASLRQARQKIGMIFQHFNLLSSRTVAENIALPLEVVGMDKQARAARVAELIDMVGLSERARAYPAQLSGGQKQRVGIARALASQPQVLLSDEATSALDPQTTRSILELLRDLNRRLGLTILLITHEMGVVKQICDRVAVLRDGRIAEQGTVAELAAQPGSLLAREIFPQHAEHAPRPGATLVTITYTSGSADEPLLSNLVRNFDIDMNILSGSIELVGGQRIGQMQIELSGGQTADALAYLRGQNLHVEVRA